MAVALHCCSMLGKFEGWVFQLLTLDVLGGSYIGCEYCADGSVDDGVPELPHLCWALFRDEIRSRNANHGHDPYHGVWFQGPTYTLVLVHDRFFCLFPSRSWFILSTAHIPPMASAAGTHEDL